MELILIEGNLYRVKKKDIEKVKKADEKDSKIRSEGFDNPYYTRNRDKVLEEIQDNYRPIFHVKHIYFY